MKINKRVKVALIVAIVVVVAAIIAGVFGLFPVKLQLKTDIMLTESKEESNTRNIRIMVINELGKPVPADITIINTVTNDTIQRSTDDKGVLQLKELAKVEYQVTAEHDGYITKIITFSQHDSDELRINLVPKPSALEVPFIFTEWYPWGGITIVNVDMNTIELNGDISGTAGYVSTGISTSMAGKTLVFHISNTANSSYSDNRLYKLTVNSNDILLKPNNIPSLVQGEYIPAFNFDAEFTLPTNFDGKIGFTFYKANFNGVRIAAFYK